MYNSNGYGILPVTPIACGLVAPKRHCKKHGFLSICIFLILPSIIINNKYVLKPRLIFNLYAHISRKNDWNIFFIAKHVSPFNHDNATRKRARAK